MIYTDYNTIEKVTPRVQGILGDNFEENVVELFNNIKSLEDKISSLRMEANTLEEDLKKMRKVWTDILPLVDIEYAIKEKEEIKQSICVGFNFGTDVNKHLH